VGLVSTRIHQPDPQTGQNTVLNMAT